MRAMNRSTRGFVLPSVMFALAIMAVMVIAIASTSDDDRMGSRSVQEGTRSFYAAEAGLNWLVAHWDSLGYNSQMPAPGDTVDVGWRTLPENRATYHAFLQRLAPCGSGGAVWVTVDGRSAAPGSGLRSVQAVVAPTSPGCGGGAALIATGKVDISSSYVDSYNSANGPYGGGNVYQNGDVDATGAVKTSGGATIGGDVSSSSTVTGGGITGNITTGAPPVNAPTVACPAGPYTASVPAGSGISYNSGTGDLTLSGSAVLTLPVPPTTYYFHKLTLSGSSSIAFSSYTQHIDIYVSNQLTLSGGGVMNTGADPTKLSIWGCGGDTSNWAISGGSFAYYSMYAPNHNLAISGASNYYGMFVGHDIAISGGSMIHYDHALGGGAGATGGAIAARTWTEITR
jgi:hypothetical protein